MAGEEGMGLGIARRRAVALAIRQILQDRRHGTGLRVHRQPDPRRQPGAVPERNEDVLDLAHRMGEVNRLGDIGHA